MGLLKLLVARILKLRELVLLRTSSIEALLQGRLERRKLLWILEGVGRGGDGEVLANTRSQLQQDLFVLFALSFKRGGFFVEFGATDGVEKSNSYLLETFFDWSGILIEPGRTWHRELGINRKATIDHRAIWSGSNMTVNFLEASDSELSTLATFKNSDSHQRQGSTYPVLTVSLQDLLYEYNAPKKIDYLSIDTEGTEYEILKSFDFDAFQFSVITVEHNFTPNRIKVKNLLEQVGYRQVLEDYSDFEDWYLNQEIDFTERVFNSKLISNLRISGL